MNNPTVTHTLFQVSTSGALVAGVFSGAVSCRKLLEHGDFGVGTFAKLDGEMIVLEGKIYQMRGDGSVSLATPDEEAPFAVVTQFSADLDVADQALPSLGDLVKRCDDARPSNNIFYAYRLDGKFDTVRARAVSPPEDHSRLVDAAKRQAEFEFTNISGTLVGLWSPGFSSAFSVPGYHFHFISDDRKHGGHLLDCSIGSARLRMESLTDFHLALPENEAFLKADLSRNSADELAYAENSH